MGVSTTIDTIDHSQSREGALKRSRSGLLKVLPVLFGVFWFGVAFCPMFYMFVTSLRTQGSFLGDSPWSLPANPTLDNYLQVLEGGFGLYVINSAFVTVVSVLLILIVALFAAYAIAKMGGRTTQVIFSLFVLGLAIPLQATIIPIYVLINNLGLYDTLFALIPPYIAFGVPLSILVLVNFIRDIPQELHESMLLDGASHFHILRSLVIPLSRPAMITVVIYESIQVWNGFLFPLVLTQSPDIRVMPYALYQFQGEFAANVPAIMAAVFLSAAPIILLYIFGRRQLLGGLIAGFSK